MASQWGPPERARIPATTQPREPRQAGHMTVYFGWPVAGAVTISLFISLAIMGVTLYRNEDVELGEAALLGGIWFLLLNAALVAVFIIAVGVTWYKFPLQLAKIQHPVSQKPKPQKKERGETAPINTGGVEPPKTHAEKMQDALRRPGKWIGDGMRAAGEWLEGEPQHRTVEAKRAYAQTTRPLQAQVVEDPPWLTQTHKDLFDVTARMWGKSLARSSFEAEYRGSDVNAQELYPWAKRQWLRLGWVRCNKKGTPFWKYDVYPEEGDLYRHDRGLRRIAESRGWVFYDPPAPQHSGNGSGTGRENQKNEPKTEKTKTEREGT
ncbi:MAG: hypothetical protein GTO49_11005 [Anaerolineae bacterium]|nr:hypothetical protein [Anaerolineae bacterium]